MCHLQHTWTELERRGGDGGDGGLPCTHGWHGWLPITAASKSTQRSTSYLSFAHRAVSLGTSCSEYQQARSADDRDIAGTLKRAYHIIQRSVGHLQLEECELVSRPWCEA